MSVALCCRRLRYSLQSRLLQQNRQGYIVLLPEIPPNVPKNSELMKNGMPDFESFTTEKCVYTFGQQLLGFEQGIREIEENLEKAGCADVVKDVIEPIERLNSPLETSWGIIKSLYLTKSSIMPPATYVPLHHRARQARSAKFYSKTIYNACKECDKSKLTEEDQRVVDKYLLEGRLSGLDLEEGKRKKLARIHIDIVKEGTNFVTRVKTSASMFQEIIHDPSITREMPDQLLRLMAENKDEPSRGPWRVNLQPQLFKLFLTHCPDGKLRKKVWEAKITVTSQQLDDNSLHNSSTLEKIRSLRRDQARMLGYETYADVSMETKMAGSVTNVRQTLNTMLKLAKPVADKEVADLQKFAWERGFEGQLNMWDVPFWQRKQQRALFNFQEETLIEYFPLEKVWSGLLAMCERLFDLKIVEKQNVDRWHPDVKFFHIFEDSNKPVAGFYLDPFVRDEKLVSSSGAAWSVNITPAATILKNLPLSILVLHLDPPVYGKPALLSLSNVETLFRQFGHLLQQLLTTVTYSEVAGFNNIEYDAVGIVSNVFHHLVMDPAVLDSISGHYATGEKLPVLPTADLVKHFAGYQTCEELFLAHLDLEMYSTNDYWLDIMKRLWPMHFVLQRQKWDSTPCNFLPIVTDQWYAAYFSHIWAKMVAADVYSAFTEPDVDVKSNGTRFRDTFLAFGGSCHPGEVFRRFRGRDPSSEAYLKYLGLH